MTADQIAAERALFEATFDDSWNLTRFEDTYCEDWGVQLAWERWLHRATLAHAERGKIIEDADCICRGNWRNIVKECQHLIGKRFKNEVGITFLFYGVVHSDDDFYYGMSSRDKTKLLSCVGSIEGHGYTLIDESVEPTK